jgi:hypothetical protein
MSGSGEDRALSANARRDPVAGGLHLGSPPFWLLAASAHSERMPDYFEFPVAGRLTPVGQIVSLGRDDASVVHHPSDTCGSTVSASAFNPSRSSRSSHWSINS